MMINDYMSYVLDPHLGISCIFGSQDFSPLDLG